MGKRVEKKKGNNTGGEEQNIFLIREASELWRTLLNQYTFFAPPDLFCWLTFTDHVPFDSI